MIFLESVGIYCQKSPFFSLVTGFLILGLGFVLIIPMLSGGLGYMYGINPQTLKSLLSNEAQLRLYHSFVLSLVGLTQVFTWGLAGWTMINLNREGGYPPVKNYFPVIYSGVLMMFASIPLIQTLSFNSETFHLPDFLKALENWIEARESQSLDMIKIFIITSDTGQMLVNLLMLALVPAVCEEMFFRGFIQKTLNRIVSAEWAIVIAATFFSFMHFQFFGFFSRLILGGILGYLFYLTRSIYPGIIAHFAYNGLMVLFGYGAGVTGYPPPEGEAMGAYPWYWTLFSIVLTFIIGVRLFRLCGNNRSQ